MIKELSSRDRKVIEAIGSMQSLLQITEYENDYKKYYFIYEDVCIVNPLTDESAMITVNPYDYYGKHFTSSNFMELLKD